MFTAVVVIACGMGCAMAPPVPLAKPITWNESNRGARRVRREPVKRFCCPTHSFVTVISTGPTAPRADTFCVSASKPEYSGSTAKASILIGCVVTLLVVMLDLCATRYLRNYEARYRQAVLEDQQRVAEYRRPLPVGEPLDQNAAVWYRLAFAKTAMQPEDTAETL